MLTSCLLAEAIFKFINKKEFDLKVVYKEKFNYFSRCIDRNFTRRYYSLVYFHLKESQYPKKINTHQTMFTMLF